MLQPHFCKPAYSFNCFRNDTDFVAVLDVVVFDCCQPFCLLEGFRKTRAKYFPNFTHMDASEGLVGQIRKIDAETGGACQQGTVVQRLAVDERAVDVPGNCADAQAAPDAGLFFRRA